MRFHYVHGIVVFCIVLAVLFVFMIISGAYRAMIYPTCSEEIEREPAITLVYPHSPFSIASNNSEDVCDYLVSYEIEDSGRTICHLMSTTDDKELTLVEVTRKSKCVVNGTDLLQVSYFGILTDGILYPIFNPEDYFRVPERDVEFADLSRQQFEALSWTNIQINEDSFYYLYGKYLFYWLKSRDLTCSDVHLSPSIAVQCLHWEAEYSRVDI